MELNGWKGGIEEEMRVVIHPVLESTVRMFMKFVSETWTYYDIHIRHITDVNFDNILGF